MWGRRKDGQAYQKRSGYGISSDQFDSENDVPTISVADLEAFAEEKKYDGERKVTARLSDLAKIPYSVLEKERDNATNEEDRVKLTKAMNLRTMRGLANNPKGMFDYEDY